MISRETISNILESAHIEEIVGDFVNLRRRGTNLVGLCPFHNEKTPSFTVSPSKGIYKCFGCGKAGNSVNFVMEHEHYSYPEALRYLAARYQIEIEEDNREEDVATRDKRESLYHLNQFAMRYFIDQLIVQDEGKAIALTYLYERKLSDEIINRFQIGYSPEGWDSFTVKALNDGYKTEQLIESGLSIEKDGRIYDRFRGRIIFPIHNMTGAVTGFGGRILKSAKNLPKYVNSPESEIYNKSKSLYGIYQGKAGIISNNECYLVEGYTDVTALHQAGIENVVASSGTSLTEDQIKLIRRYTPNITILYDGDEAGLKASFRGIDMILEQGMNVRIVLFPEGEDPDSYSRSRSRNEVRDFIKHGAKNFILFKTGLLMKEAGDDPLRRADMIKELVSSVALIPDTISRSIHLKECAQLTAMSEPVLINEMNKILRRKSKANIVDLDARIEEKTLSSDPTLPPDPRDSTYQERNIIRVLLNHGHKNFIIEKEDENGRPEQIEINTATFLIQDLESDNLELSQDVHRKLLREYKKKLEEKNPPGLKYFINHEDPELSACAIDISSNQYSMSANWAAMHKIIVAAEEDNLKNLVFDSIYAFKLKKIEQMLKDVNNRIKHADDEETIMQLQKEKIKLDISKQYISKELGRIITH